MTKWEDLVPCPAEHRSETRGGWVVVRDGVAYWDCWYEGETPAADVRAVPPDWLPGVEPVHGVVFRRYPAPGTGVMPPARL